MSYRHSCMLLAGILRRQRDSQ